MKNIKKCFYRVVSFAIMILMLYLPAGAVALEDLETINVNTQVENYLTERVNGIYFYDSVNLAQYTLKDPSIVYDASMCLEIENTCSNLLSSAATTSMSLEVEKNAVLSFDSIVDNLTIDEELTTFFGHVYETQEVTYKYFDCRYVFSDTEIQDNYAITKVEEHLDYQYSNCDNPSSEITIYDVTSIKINGEWRVASVASDDLAFASYYNTGFDAETAIHAYDAANTGSAVVMAQTPSDTSASVLVLSSGDLQYNKQNAINYALTYTTSGDDGTFTPTLRNKNFYWFGADCMNFVSQCLWAGFGGSNSEADINNYYMMDRTGTYQWYCNGSGNQSRWASCSQFKGYVENNGATEGAVFARSEIAGDSNVLSFSKSDIIGSAVLVRGSSNGVAVQYGHAVFINDATGTTTNTRETVYFCAYNSCRKNVQLGLKYPASGSTLDNMYVIRPVKFAGGNTENRIWADLHNATLQTHAQANGVTLTGYSNKTWDKMSLALYTEDGQRMISYTYSNVSSIIETYPNFFYTGEWKVVVTGTDSDGSSNSFTYTIRIV